MALSAADLQKKHALEGAPDPFPTIITAPSTSSPSPAGRPNSTSATSNSNPPVDTNSEEAFPSLGGPSPAPALAAPKTSLWSKKIRAPAQSAPGGAGRSGTPSGSSLPASTSFSLPVGAVSLVGKGFAELTKKIKDQYGCTVETSTQGGNKTFMIRGQDERKLAGARKLIERGVSKIETIGVEVPLSTLGTIIGPKGATLKTITDATGVKIDIPRRETLPSAPVKAENGETSDAEDDEEEPEDPSVTISLTGPTPALSDAKTRILSLISDKISQTSIKIKDIPSDYYPFLAGPKGSLAKELEQTLGEGKVQVHVPPPAVWRNLEKQADASAAEEVGVFLEKKRDVSITVRGERERVAVVVQDLRRRYEEIRDNSRTLTISIPKRQHRFLVGSNADDILEKHKCIVDLPSIDDPSDSCTIRGPGNELANALNLVMVKANAVTVETVDLVAQHRSSASDPLAHAKTILHYLLRTSTLRQIADAQTGVKIYPPFQVAVENSGNVVIEVVGEDRKEVLKAKEAVLAAVKVVTPAHVKPVEVDFALHKFLIGKKGAKIAQFQTTYNAKAVFPPAGDESSSVLIVYSGTEETLPKDKKQQEAKVQEALKKASEALLDLAKEAADVKTETIEVEQKFHRHVVGPGGSVLRSLLGEEQLASISVGNKDAKQPQDVIVVRGPSGEVDRIVPAIKQIVEDAKNDDIINGFTREFSVDKRHVPHLVGSSGAAINKLRESLSVRINFDDEENTNKKAAKNPQVKCTIIGRKEAVEEAKTRLEAQIERLADETTEVVIIKRALHPALIGSSGKYAIRLEEKYAVKITFPRDSKDGEEAKSSQKPDEVIIRGGKKGVAGAKAELVEAAEFEKESNQSATFTVPTGAVARILGRAGATINSIKDDTGAQIDVDKTSDSQTTITVRGDKKAIAAAKSQIQSIASEVADRTEDSVEIDPKYHRALIGQGGQRLRDLIVKAGGPPEQGQQAGLVNFPRAGDASPNVVRLRGERAFVTKIKAELERSASELQNQVVLGVAVPVASHAIKIGRGGSALQDLQKKTGATIQFPGSRQYNGAGEVDNLAELGDIDPKELVKVLGTKEACQQAIEALSAPVESQSRPRTPIGRNGTPQSGYKAVSVPAKYFHALTDQNLLQRQLRQAGIQLDLPSNAPARPEPKRPSAPTSEPGAKSARIDEDEEDAGDAAINYAYEESGAYDGYAEGDLEFGLRGKAEILERGEEIVKSAIEKAESANKIGVLAGIPRSAFPRIIGSKGATIARLRAETGAEIQVGKEDDFITITGDSESLGFARDAIISIASRRGQRF